eukprot:gene11791-24707_t
MQIERPYEKERGNENLNTRGSLSFYKNLKKNFKQSAESWKSDSNAVSSLSRNTIDTSPEKINGTIIASGDDIDKLIENGENSSIKQVYSIYKSFNPNKSQWEIDNIIKKYVGKENELIQKLKAKYYIDQQQQSAHGEGPMVFMTFTASNQLLGKIVFKLYMDQVPLTSENFRSLCTGEKGVCKISKAKLHYMNCRLHRIVPGFVVQGGDITRGDGTGGTSIYAGTPDADLWGNFRDESFMAHDRRGLLSMANNGPNRN